MGIVRLFVCLMAFFSISSAFGQAADPGPSTAQMTATCEAGNGGACLALAGRFAAGSSATPKDLAKAEVYFSKACDLGGERACLQAGKFYASGKMGTGKETVTLRFLERACRTPNKSIEACMMAGSAYSQSTNDEPIAADLFGRACGFGEGGACLRTGILFSRRPEGLGAAISYFDKACARQIQEGCALRESGNDKLAEQLGPRSTTVADRKRLQLTCAVSYEIATRMFGNNGVGPGMRGLTYGERALATLGISKSSGKPLPDEIKTRITTVSAAFAKTGQPERDKADLKLIIEVCDKNNKWAPVPI
ncbi:MAG: hypothetical protein V4808_16445 [Pseudomonadota bacterium]